MHKNRSHWRMVIKSFTQLIICWFVAFLVLIVLDMKTHFAIWALTVETLELRNDIIQSTMPWLHGMPFFALLLLLIIYVFDHLDRLGNFGWLGKWSVIALAAILMEVFRMGIYGVSIRLLLHTMLTVGLVFPLVFVAHQIDLWGVENSADARSWRPAQSLLKVLGGILLFSSFGAGYFALMHAIDAQCIRRTEQSCVEEDKTTNIEDVFISTSISSGAPNTSPLQTVFTLEKLDHRITDIFGDIDENGSVDFVHLDNLLPTVILNSRGVLHISDYGLSRFLNFPVAQLAIADLNRDGLADMLVVRKNFDPNLLYRLIRESAFQPVVDERFSAEILLQTSSGVWRNATQEMFRGNPPVGFVKVEPIIFADINHDGWLDFIWHQYPHRTFGSLNSVYIRDSDGRYVDRMEEYFDSKSSRIMPEGADFADVNGDGEIDLFAFGYPNIAANGKYHRVCGSQYANMPCEVSRRLEEGATFFDLGGTPHLALSYWGTSEVFPHKALYFFKATETGGFTPIASKSQGVFRGINTYLIAKDLDLNGTEELLTSQPARLLAWDKNLFLDALPSIAPSLVGKKIQPIGLVDFDDDGDIDILLNIEGDPATYLLRSNLNPKSFVRISTKSAEGFDNQFGATLTFKSDDKQDNWWRAYRPRRGYWGDTDPRIVVKPRTGQNYSVRTCYPSISPLDGEKPYSSSAISVRISSFEKSCITYQLTVFREDAKVNLTLLAGGKGFRVD